MLQAMNTGHDGSLSTGHANSAQDMMTRLETMVLMGVELPLAAIRGQIASAIDIVFIWGVYEIVPERYFLFRKLLVLTKKEM